MDSHGTLPLSARSERTGYRLLGRSIPREEEIGYLTGDPDDFRVANMFFGS